MNLTSRDKKLLTALPAILVFILYAFNSCLPQRDTISTLKAQMTAGGTPGELQQHIEMATIEYQRITESRDATVSAAGNHWLASVDRKGTLTAVERLQHVQQRIAQANLHVVDSNRIIDGARGLGRPPIPLPPEMDKWKMLLQGTYPEIHSFLLSITETTSIPESLEMDPALEPGKPSMWELYIWI